MAHRITTLPEFIQVLKANPELPLVFSANGQKIQAGYHVTELKHAAVSGIDCGARRDSWDETIIQLLDGGGQGSHMTAVKFVKIAEQSIKAMPELATGRLRFEFAPENGPTRLFSSGQFADNADVLQFDLTPEVAVCKPALTTVGCCGASAVPAVEQGCCAA